MRIKNPLFVFAGAIALAATLTACADDKQVFPAPTLMSGAGTAVDPDPAALRLARAAEQASGALNRMAEIESFRTPMPNDSGMNFGHPALMQPINLTWTGPIEQVARTLAEMAGFSFKVVSKAGPAPIVVSINAYQEPIGGVLRDIGLQAGRRADIIVDVGTMTINLRYAPDDGTLRY